MSESRGKITAADFDRWVTGAFEMDINTLGAQRRGAMLDKLHEADLVPPDEWRAALLVGMSEPFQDCPTEEAVNEESMRSQAAADRTEDGAAAEISGQRIPRSILEFKEKSVRREVEDFAQRFFMQPPEKREARIRELRADANAFCPQSIAWLNQLNTAVSTELRLSDAPADMAHLAQSTARVFAAHPANRTDVGRQLLSEYKSEPARWARVTEQILQGMPHIAALSPGFLKSVSNLAIKPPLGRISLGAPSPPAPRPKQKTNTAVLVIAIVMALLGITAAIVVALSQDWRFPQDSGQSQPVESHPGRGITSPPRMSENPFSDNSAAPWKNGLTDSMAPGQGLPRTGPGAFPSRQYDPTDPINRSRPRPTNINSGGFGGGGRGGGGLGGGGFGG